MGSGERAAGAGAPTGGSGWGVLSGSVRGPTHERSGAPNQDAVAVARPAGALVVAVSDGHGSKRCFRSDVGSRLAVDIAVSLASEVASDLAGSGEVGLLDDLGQQITEVWQQAVRSDLADRPVTDAELDRGGIDRTTAERDPLRSYGATLMVCIVTARGVACMQLGDGDIVLVDDTGEAHQPLPDDDRLLADETTSLCLPDAGRDFRTAYAEPGTVGIATVLLATDGYGNSFSSDTQDTWHAAVGADMLEHLRSHGPAWVDERLDTWLGESAEHSGDDTTLAVLYRGDAIGVALVEDAADDALVEGTPAVEGAIAEDAGVRERRAFGAVAMGEAGDEVAEVATRVDGAGNDVPGGAEPAPAASVPRRRRGRSAGLALLGLLVGLAAGFLAARVFATDAGTGEPERFDSVVLDGQRWTVDGDSLEITDLGSGATLERVTIGTALGDFGATGGSIWVANEAGTAVFRIDTADRSWRCLSAQMEDNPCLALTASPDGSLAPDADSPPTSGPDE